jgi:tetratricopeptide (TPR) repeat protein
VANFYDWDWETAHTNFQKSAELAPNDAMIINMLGDYYRTINHPKLIETEQRAFELDPLQFFNHTDLVAAYAHEKDWPNVIIYAQKAIKMNSLVNYQANQLVVKYFLTLAYLKLNKLEEALKLAENESEEFRLFVNANVAIAENKTEEAGRLTELIDSYNRFGSVPCYLRLGIWDEALLRLEEAYAERDPKMILTVENFEEYQEQKELSSFMNKRGIKELLDIRKNNGKIPMK